MNRPGAAVIIAGGGPVGLTLAMDLASRGVEVLVIERREHAEPPSVKCNHISARSMEIFRRLGVADELRASGLGSEHPHDCAYRTAFIGPDLSRTILPSPAGRARGETGADTWWPTPEPPHRVNQVVTEPILTRHAVATDGLTLRNRTQVEAITQDSGGVQVTVRDLETDETETLRAQFAVGCDGPRSTVRELIGAKLDGPPLMGRVLSTLIRAPGLMELPPDGPAWATGVWNPRRSGAVFAINGSDQFLVHVPLMPDEGDFETMDRDRLVRTVLGVGDDYPFEILSIEDYIGRGLVADRFRDGRVFLAGDAAHLWMPFAGYGMNAGIADAASLAWMLAAHLRGGAPAEILTAYERERQPVTGQVMQYAMSFVPHLIALALTVPATIEDKGPEGDAARAEFGQKAKELNTQQYAAGGLNFGYFYDDSPLIVYDGETAPPYTMGSFESSTVPGVRAPHVWLDGGVSLYDALDGEYGIVRSDPGVDPGRLVDALRAAAVPVSVVDVDGNGDSAIYDRALTLVRPDQHVAWRADAVPQDVAALVDRLRGASLE